MERDVERLVEILVLLEVRPVAGPRDEDQVPRRRDRQQLGESLHEPENQRLPVREGGSLLPPADQGEHDGDREQRRGGPVDEGSAHRTILASHAGGGAVRNSRKLHPSGERSP